MKFGRTLLPFLFILPAVPSTADTLTDLLPPDTKAVFGIRVHNLPISSIAQTLSAQAHAATAGLFKAAPLDGIDLLRDIDEVLLASTGMGQNPPSIVVVTGRFDVARLAEGANRYHDVPYFAGEVAPNSAVALLGNGVAILGDAALVRAAVDQRGSKVRIDPALNDRITSMRQRYDIWGLGERPEGIVAPMADAKILESIDRFQFGMQLASGLELNAEIHARSPQDAEKLNGTLGMIAAMVKGQQTSENGSKFDLQVDGGTLKLTVFIPDAELKAIAEASVLSPVSASASALVISSEPVETGPSSAEAPALAPPEPAPCEVSSKTAKPKMFDKEPDTVVFTLPGKK